MCKTICKMCKHLVVSQEVLFGSGNLVINIPEGSYADGEKYCIVVAQNIPATTTVNAPVYITIGDGIVPYPLNRRDGSQAVASQIRTRTRYSTRVATTPTSGSFNLLCCLPNSENNDLPAINGDVPT